MTEGTLKRSLVPAVLLTASLLLIVFGQLMAKHGASLVADGFERWPVALPFIAMAYMALLTRGLLWVVVLRRLALSVAYPVIALSYVLILGASRLIYGEPIGALKAAGAALIIAGVTVLGLAKFRAMS